jgi:hypothetical protein
MNMKHFKLTYKTVFFLGIVLFLYSPAYAAISGQCANCHTMHDSQNGSNVGADGQFSHLLNDSCIGCHTGTNSGGAIPYVLSTTEPTYGTDTLAGGNFYWVASGLGGNDTKGHNVLGVSSPDTNLAEAPGNPYGCASSCHMSLAVEQTAVSGLGSGCEGCHLELKHHAPNAAPGEVATEANGWFRFLAGHMGGANNGVQGIEDSDWEYTKAAGDHNEYLGNVGDHSSSTNSLTTNTMTAYCCGCHGTFHEQVDSGLWIRHPSDAVIPNSGEYASYTAYSTQAPVARNTLSGISATVTPGTDMVMCLSCHRAHGSPYADMLRWDYNTQIAGGGGGGSDNTGCFTCHTAKDE